MTKGPRKIGAFVLMLGVCAGAAEPARDRFGDPLPEGVLVRLGTVRQRAVAARVGLSSDGKTIITVASGRQVKFWEADTGKLRESRELPVQSSYQTYLSRDGRLLAVQESDANSPLDIWDVIAGKRLASLPQQGGVYRTAFAPDGKTLAISQTAVARVYVVRLWEHATGEQRDLKGATRLPESMTFSPDGKMLAATDGRSIFCWNCTTGEQLWKQKGAFGVTLAFTPDGRTLIASAGDPESAWHAWDAVTGKPENELKLPKGYNFLEIVVAPDGRTLVIAQQRNIQVAGQRVRLWDLQAGKLLHTLNTEGLIGPFFPDGKSFLTNDGTLQRWDLATGRPLLPDTYELGHRSEVFRVVYSPDGRRLASTARNDAIYLWDVATAKPLYSLRGHEATALIFTLDGKLLISGSTREGELHIWDTQSGALVRRILLYEGERARLEQAVVKLQLTPDDRTIFALRYKNSDGPKGDLKAILSSWDLATGKRKTQVEIEPSDGFASAFSPDGRMLASRGELLDTATGNLRVKLEGGPSALPQYVFTPDGQRVAGLVTHKVREGQRTSTKWDGIQVWDAATGQALRRIPTDHFLGHLAFSPDGRYLAADDMQGLRLWEMETGEVVMRHKAHEQVRGSFAGSFASCLAFAPDGRSLATGHPDSTVLIWNLLPSVRPATDKDLPNLWKDLIGSDTAGAYAASWRLTNAPSETIHFLREHLRPVSAASVEQVRPLLADLDNDDFAKREAAVSRLRELGERAASFLREELKAHPSLEKRRRVEELLNDLEKPPSGETLRTLRAMAVLERIGTAEARRILETLAQGMQQARVTQEAKVSLGRFDTRNRAEKR